MMRNEDFERPTDEKTLRLKCLRCGELADEWFSRAREVKRWKIAHQFIGWITGYAAGKVSENHALWEEVWTEILIRFEPVLLDACEIARPSATQSEFEAEFVVIASKCNAAATAGARCLPEVLWCAASEQLNLDGVAHVKLRRKFHLRALLDNVDPAGDHRGTVRMIAFPTGDERRQQRRAGRQGLEEFYNVHRESLSIGCTMFARTVHRMRMDIADITCGAIREKDLPDATTALRLIGACLAREAA